MMTAAGVSMAAAVAYADWMSPHAAAQQLPSTDGEDAYPTTTTTTAPATTTTTTAPTTTARGEVEGSATVRPGERKVFKGGGFAGNAPLGLEFQSAPVSLGTTTADASGNFRVTITIPLDATAGAHRLVARGSRAGGGTHEVFADVTVVVATGALSLTGTDVGLLGGAGVAAAAGGTALVRASRWVKRIRGTKATPTDGPPEGWGQD
jgi:hypothetical protein